MKLGIIGAMDDEIAMYLDKIENLQKTEWKIFTFYEGQLYDKEVVLVKSGVGKVFAAMICQHLIDRFHTTQILFTGVGGSLNKDLDIGDVIVGQDTVHHDFDAQPLGFKRGQISYTDYRFFEAEKALVALAAKAPLENHKIAVGRILTGDQFFTQADKEQHTYLTEELAGDCIEMEGAAVAQVCVMNEVPHVVIRTVSDKADGSAVADYNTFKSTVAHNSFAIVCHVVQHLV